MKECYHPLKNPLKSPHKNQNNPTSLIIFSIYNVQKRRMIMSDDEIMNAQGFNHGLF